MLLLDVTIYIEFSSTILVVLMYQQFNQSQPQSLAQAKIQSVLLGIDVFSGYIPFCIECYTNLLVSRTFHHEMQTLLSTTEINRKSRLTVQCCIIIDRFVYLAINVRL